MKYLIFLFFIVATNVNADNEKEKNRVLLNDHEPNLIGLSYDDDDQEYFMDFKISLEYPLAQDYLNSTVKDFNPTIRKICSNDWIKSCQPYFAFTGRFGQYIFDRDSAPVISKRFNPKIFFRLAGKDGNYLDLEYAHESNGQRISSIESYNALADDFEDNDEKRSYANDYISRGWDYVGFTYKYKLQDQDISFYLSYANYIGGILQGDIEEYNDWEAEVSDHFDWQARRKITSRDQVSGLRLLIKKKGHLYRDYKAALVIETGTDNPFKYNTYKIELMTKIQNIPVMIWARTGYNSDLAQYFKEVSSYGITFEFRTFE